MVVGHHGNEHRHDHDHGHGGPRYSYGVRSYSYPGIPYTYSPEFWPRQRAKLSTFLAGENAGRNQALMIGGAVLGVAAVGALIWVAAKHH